MPKDEIKAYSFGHDFGWTSPSAQIVTGWDHDRRVYSIDEFYQTKASIELYKSGPLPPHADRSTG